MAFSPSDLYLEVLALIAEHSTNNQIISRGWLVTAELKAHPIMRHNNKNPDDFSLCCRQLAVSAAVDQALARLKHEDEGHIDPDARELDLPRLPGFKHLRQIYPIRRNDIIFLVPLVKMTENEINRKIRIYRKASRGYEAHADELERYLAARTQAA